MRDGVEGEDGGVVRSKKISSVRFGTIQFSAVQFGTVLYVKNDILNVVSDTR